MKILVLGATGMLGSATFRLLSSNSQYQVFGSARNDSARRYFAENLRERVISGVDVDNIDSLTRAFDEVRPTVVVNCVGLIKQLAGVNDPLTAIPINSILPHRLSRLCSLMGARLIHVSTDCVFSGNRGNYSETDVPDAEDLYGRSKYLGEVADPHTITLRTSIIGHGLRGEAHSLVGWFLSQTGVVNGYTQAIFSGLPTVELARVIGDIIIPRTDLSGLYQVASEPIAKFELLRLIAKTYDKSIEITPCEDLKIDRSLNGTKFRMATGYLAPQWPDLVASMHSFWESEVNRV